MHEAPAAPRRHPCLSAANPRFTYRVEALGFRGTSDDAVAGTARFNAWSSAIGQGQLVTVHPNQSKTTEVSIDPSEWSLTPAQGLMIVTLDNESAGDEAPLIPVSVAQPSLAQVR